MIEGSGGGGDAAVRRLFQAHVCMLKTLFKSTNLPDWKDISHFYYFYTNLLHLGLDISMQRSNMHF